MKGKERLAQKTQDILKRIAVETVGRSIPWGIYEKRMDEYLVEEIRKVKGK